MELWIPITVVAAFLQNIRSALQKHLKGVMGTSGATFVRFGFGAPFALGFTIVLHLVPGYPLPRIGTAFILWVVLGGLAQIAATGLLVYLFSFRNFTVGSAYSRTEPAQAAMFGLLFLGETVSASTVGAIAVSLAGVMLISVARTVMSMKAFLTSMFARTALIGLASGTFFGVSGVAYRAASLSLGGPNFVMQAAVTLSCVILFQTAVMLLFMMAFVPGEIGRVVRAWRPSLVVGMAGATASFGWFAAMTLQQVALVKAVAQVEMIFTFATSVLVFREHVNRREIAGCVLIIAGVITLVLTR